MEQMADELRMRFCELESKRERSGEEVADGNWRREKQEHKHRIIKRNTMIQTAKSSVLMP